MKMNYKTPNAELEVISLYDVITVSETESFKPEGPDDVLNDIFY